MKNLYRYRLLLFSFLSGILLSLPWAEWCTGVVMAVAFVPLLWIEDEIDKNGYSNVTLLMYAALTFFIWNVLTTWWIKNASFVGMLVAFLVNTFVLTMTFWIFHLCKRKLNSSIGYFGFIVFWIAFEHFYLNAEISWTWLNVGNALAKDIRLIQWYEYTGTLGGTLWLLLINVLVINLILKWQELNKLKGLYGYFIILFLLIIIPVTYSIFRYNTYQEEDNPVEVVVIQPNVDPYQKFINLTNREQTLMLLEIANEKASKQTVFFIAPETAITSYSEIDRLNQSYYINVIRQFVKYYPNSSFIVGMMLKKTYDPDDVIPSSARKYQNVNKYYDQYNSAVLVDTSKNLQIYHKSKLVVGVEKMPYAHLLNFLKKLTLRLGGTFRDLAVQDERENLVSMGQDVKIAPVICWENVFGEYVTDYVKKGANLIAVITNEGWWGDTPGYKQLNHLSQIRAIETRRCVARSANTGISSLINQKGEVIDFLGWWQKGALKGILNANDNITFYVKHGDYLARISYFFALIVIIYAFVGWQIQKKPGKKLFLNNRIDD